MRVEDNGTRFILAPEDIETAEDQANSETTPHEDLIAELASLDRIS